MIGRILGCVVVVVLALQHEAAGQCEHQKLVASNGNSGDRLGIGVAVGDGWMILGAYRDDAPETNSGSAYVFELENGIWVERENLTASDGAAGDEFGSRIAISGTLAVLTSSRDNNENGLNSGSAYVLELSPEGAWVEKTKLLATDGDENDRFGTSVAIDQGTVVVGAHQDDQNGPSSGSAYVFRRVSADRWVQEAKLLPLDGQANDFFGQWVDISGARIIVGARGDELRGNPGPGSAYIFRRDAPDTWIEEAKLVPSDGQDFDQFGTGVRLEGNLAFVSAPGPLSQQETAGAVYVFEWDGVATWIEIQKIEASDGLIGDTFGSHLAVEGHTLVVGARFDDTESGVDSGSAYLFREDASGQWIEIVKLLSSDGAAGDIFGALIDLHGEVLAIGAHRDDDNGSESGSVYVFDVSEADCDADGVSDFCDILAGAPDENSNNIPDECECQADVNNSGAVNVIDLIHLLACFGLPAVPECVAEDVNGDGIVNVLDLIELLLAFGTSCP